MRRKAFLAWQSRHFYHVHLVTKGSDYGYEKKLERYCKPEIKLEVEYPKRKTADEILGKGPPQQL